MKLLELKLDRLHAKVTSKHLLLMAGDRVGRMQGRHFTQYWKPRKDGKLNPHLSIRCGKRNSHTPLGAFTPARFVRVMRVYEREVRDRFLAATKRVEPEALEADGWFFACPDVMQQWFARFAEHPGVLRVTEEMFEGIEEVVLEAARPTGMLTELPHVEGRPPIGAFRLEENGECNESATLTYFTHGLGEGPGWYLTRQPFITLKEHEELMQRLFPASFWRALLKLNDYLQLNGDREKMMRFIEAASRHTPGR